VSTPPATHAPLHEWARNLNAHAESVEALAGPERSGCGPWSAATARVVAVSLQCRRAVYFVL
jgi:hypothetical protein